MTDSLTVSAYSVASDRRCMLEPPNDLEKLPRRQLIVLGGCLSFLGVMWFCITILLYNVTIEYYVSLLYEARWLPSVILITGVFCILLMKFKLESLFICCATSTLYSFACCQVVFVVYAVNLYRTSRVNDGKQDLGRSLPPDEVNLSALSTLVVTSKPLFQSRHYYIKLCAGMCVICLLGLVFAAILVWRLCYIAVSNYVYISLPRSLGKFFSTSGTVFLGLSLYSCYFAFQVLALPFSYVHAYMIQELLCGLTLLLQTIFQFVLIFRPNRLLLKVLIVLNIFQFIQETFYSWNSYYISLYIHSSKAKLAIDFNYDQTVMTVNFLAHFVRAVLCAYTAMRLTSIFDFSSFRWAIVVENFVLGVNIQRLMVAVTCVYLLLAICHVSIDICYTAMVHIYRTLVAFTGISVLYLTLIGISLSYYIRYKTHMALALSAVFVLLIISVSAHALYVYVDSSINEMLMNHLETLGREKRQPSMMHFAEAALAFVSLCVSLVTAFVLFRIMHLQSVRVPREPGSTLTKVLTGLRFCAVVLLLLNTVETLCNAMIRQNWQLFDNTIAYNVLDIISMYVLEVVQLHVALEGNNHFSLPLIVLFFLLLFEVLTTFNYLGSYTNYMQLLIVLNRLTSWMFSDSSVVETSGSGAYSLDLTEVNMLMPLSEMTLLLVTHAIQLIQWVLTMVSVTLVAVTFELLVRRESQLKADQVIQDQAQPMAAVDHQLGYVNEAPVFP